jgi:hypothetical protein
MLAPAGAQASARSFIVAFYVSPRCAMSCPHCLLAVQKPREVSRRRGSDNMPPSLGEAFVSVIGDR